MATYAVSFTIAEKGDRSKRYTSLMERIRKQPRVWAETTSFCLVESNATLTDFERDLYLTEFSPTQGDKMLVIAVDGDPAISRGVEYRSTLTLLLPKVEHK